MRRSVKLLITKDVYVLTIKVGGPDKGDVDSEIAVVGRAVKAEIDAKRHRRPCRVLRVAVEADLISFSYGRVSKSLERVPCWPASPSTSQRSFETVFWSQDS